MNEIYVYVLLIGLTIVYTILYVKLYAKVSLLNQLTRGFIDMKTRGKTSVYKTRKRYVVFSIISNKNFDKQDLEKSIREFYRKYFGEILLVQADPQLIYFDQSLQRGIVRTTHIHKDSVIVTLSLIREVNGRKCLLIPLRTTGTIKKARKILYKLHEGISKT